MSTIDARFFCFPELVDKTPEE